MHAMINPYIVFLTCFVCVLMMRIECGWGLGEDSNFLLEGLKIEFSGIFKQ